MKKISLLMIAAITLLSSCGIASQYASSDNGTRFQDGIYSSSPSFRSRTEKTESQSRTDALVEETKASKIYLFGDKKDTVMIPENMSASIRYDKSLASTVVTVGENPYSWQNNIDPWAYYTPYSLRNSWYWNTWSYTPWRYHGWYDPFYTGGWYDPWYYGYSGWYGGWYGGWYDPWYGYMYPHYCGWYGGWDPYWYHHHHHYHYPVYHPIDKNDHWAGGRRQTGSDRVFTSRVSTRGGVGTTSRISRTASTSAGRVSTGVASSGTRTTATRVTSAPARAAASRNPATASGRQTSTVKTPVTTVSNHRKPSAAATRPTSSPSVSRSTTGRSSGTASYRSSTSSSSYRTGSSSSYRSSGTSSSYRSSSPSTTRSSGYSSGSSSRSYSGGSRSGGSSGGRR